MWEGGRLNDAGRRGMDLQMGPRRKRWWEQSRALQGEGHMPNSRLHGGLCTNVWSCRVSRERAVLGAARCAEGGGRTPNLPGGRGSAQPLTCTRRHSAELSRGCRKAGGTSSQIGMELHCTSTSIGKGVELPCAPRPKKDGAALHLHLVIQRVELPCARLPKEYGAASHPHLNRQRG